jgi:hypothetical protein
MEIFQSENPLGLSGDDLNPIFDSFRADPSHNARVLQGCRTSDCRGNQNVLAINPNVAVDLRITAFLPPLEREPSPHCASCGCAGRPGLESGREGRCATLRGPGSISSRAKIPLRPCPSGSARVRPGSGHCLCRADGFGAHGGYAVPVCRSRLPGCQPHSVLT